VKVADGLTFATLSAGSSSICGVTTAGVAYCWGANDHGQLGDGTTISSNAPVKVAGQP
jgi:alpha-tubulin suppressor-like RCC1 family protein